MFRLGHWKHVQVENKRDFQGMNSENLWATKPVSPSFPSSLQSPDSIVSRLSCSYSHNHAFSLQQFVQLHEHWIFSTPEENWNVHFFSTPPICLADPAWYSRNLHVNQNIAPLVISKKDSSIPSEFSSKTTYQEIVEEFTYYWWLIYCTSFRFNTECMFLLL